MGGLTMEERISITAERYEQLIRAERDASLLKALLTDCHENYHSVSREDLNLLYTMFIGKKEEE